jgi:hypothetical protein
MHRPNNKRLTQSKVRREVTSRLALKVHGFCKLTGVAEVNILPKPRSLYETNEDKNMNI